jgi:hypothetical protein
VKFDSEKIYPVRKKYTKQIKGCGLIALYPQGNPPVGFDPCFLIKKYTLLLKTRLRKKHIPLKNTPLFLTCWAKKHPSFFTS